MSKQLFSILLNVNGDWHCWAPKMMESTRKVHRVICALPRTNWNLRQSINMNSTLKTPLCHNSQRVHIYSNITQLLWHQIRPSQFLTCHNAFCRFIFVFSGAWKPQFLFTFIIWKRVFRTSFKSFMQERKSYMFEKTWGWVNKW